MRHNYINSPNALENNEIKMRFKRKMNTRKDGSPRNRVIMEDLDLRLAIQQDDGWLADPESGIQFQKPLSANRPIWYVNYCMSSRSEGEVMHFNCMNIGPTTYDTASSIFDDMENQGATMISISTRALKGWTSKPYGK